MKISGVGSTGSTLAGGRADSAKSARPETPATVGDDVKLSSAGALGGAAPTVDSARVSEIRQAIAEGRFQINSGAIADRLIEVARELVDSRAKG